MGERGGNVDIKEYIINSVSLFIKKYEEKNGVLGIWREPLVGFADTYHPYIQNLKNIIGPEHLLPQDVMEDSKIIIACFVPFTKNMSDTNITNDIYSSPQWAKAYEDTNAMFVKLIDKIISDVESLGYKATVPPEAFTFDQIKLKSNWSQRHFAYAAGLGTFGINNMLITKKGGCGRYTTIVTNLDVKADSPIEEELCLYKKNRTCGICVKHCPSGALTTEGYDRQKCYEICKLNSKKYTEFGSSYVDDKGKANSIGSEVCGKCVVKVPCAYGNLK